MTENISLVPHNEVYLQETFASVIEVLYKCVSDDKACVENFCKWPTKHKICE